jgi:opacity protein-like surface antigen
VSHPTHNKPSRRVTLTLLSGFLFSTQVFGATTTPFLDYFKHAFWHPIVTLSSGVAFNTNAGKPENFPAQNGIFSFYNYSVNSIFQTQPLVGGFIGAEFLLNPTWCLQAGVGYYQPTTFQIKGSVTQGVDLFSSDKYAYHYSIESRQLLIETKLLYHHWQTYHPYLTLGLGAAFNNAKNFQVNIQPPFTTVSNQFGNNTTTSFTYSLGFGMDVNVLEHVRIGGGYRFADLGGAKTAKSTINTIATNNTLSQSHLYAHEVLIQLTFDVA